VLDEASDYANENLFNVWYATEAAEVPEKRSFRKVLAASLRGETEPCPPGPAAVRTLLREPRASLCEMKVDENQQYI